MKRASDFPVDEVRGRHYSGWESGTHYHGVVADAVVENGFVSVINTDGKEVFGYDEELGGSWHWKGDVIVVSVKYIGSYRLVRPDLL